PTLADVTFPLSSIYSKLPQRRQPTAVSVTTEQLWEDVNSNPYSINLANAYTNEDQYDHAILVWWRLLKMNKFNRQVWTGFRNTYDLKRRSVLGITATTSMFKFLWLCFLAVQSRKFLKWKIGEVDWWPLAKKD